MWLLRSSSVGVAYIVHLHIVFSKEPPLDSPLALEGVRGLKAWLWCFYHVFWPMVVVGHEDSSKSAEFYLMYQPYSSGPHPGHTTAPAENWVCSSKLPWAPSFFSLRRCPSYGFNLPEQYLCGVCDAWWHSIGWLLNTTFLTIQTSVGVEAIQSCQVEWGWTLEIAEHQVARSHGQLGGDLMHTEW